MSARSEVWPILLLAITLLALFLVNSGLMGGNPIAAACLALCVVGIRKHDTRLLLAIMVPLAVLGSAVVAQDLAVSPDEQLLNTKYALMSLVFGGGFGYIIVLCLRSIEAKRALGIFALFSAAHAIWALIFVKYAPLDSNVVYQGFSMQRQNVVAMPLLRFWSYDNQVIGITYFTVLPVVCAWAAIPWKKKKLSAIILVASALLGLYCAAQFVTRIPLVVAVVAFAFFLLREFTWAKWGKRFGILAGAGALLIAGAAILSQSNAILVQDYLTRFTDASGFSRVTVWSNAFDVIAKNPAGGARASMLADSYAHNCFLDWMLDFGWFVGGLWSVAFIVYFGWIGLLTLKRGVEMDSAQTFQVLWSFGIGATILIDPPTYPRMLYLITSSTVALAMALTRRSFPEQMVETAQRVRSASKQADRVLR